jgi:GTP pyrophosphokinase
MRYDKVIEALFLAEKYHRGQKRSDGKNYYYHILNVHLLLVLVGSSPETQIAGILHDILEDTDCKEEYIKEQFGEKVLSLIKEVTKDPITKIFPIRSKEAWLIKLCDIVDNCTDMKDWDEKRMRKYLEKKREFLGLR